MRVAQANATLIAYSMEKEYEYARIRTDPPLKSPRTWAGADDGNRTRVASLGSWNSAIELHPHWITNFIIAQKQAICNRYFLKNSMKICLILLTMCLHCVNL